MAEPRDKIKELVLGYNGIHPFSKIDITDRTSVQELLKTLLDPLEVHFSPLKARVRVPGGTAVRFDNTAAEIEGICRPLWALASLLAGGGTYKGTVCFPSFYSATRIAKFFPSLFLTRF
jgi:hypothetical protein